MTGKKNPPLETERVAGLGGAREPLSFPSTEMLTRTRCERTTRESPASGCKAPALGPTRQTARAAAAGRHLRACNVGV